MTEPQIQTKIKESLARNPQAERKLFDHFAPKVFAIARRYAPDDAAAEDWVQETFVAVFSKLKKYDPERGDFGGWLHAVAVNTCLLELRKLRRQPRFQNDEPPPDLPDTPDEPDPFFENISETELLEAIRSLPDGYRQVLNLAVFEQWSHRQIADALGISESASRSQLTRAKHFLKNLLSKFFTNHPTKSLPKLPKYATQGLV